MKLQLTTLIENNPDKDGKLLSEHGLSLYVEADGLRLLFDTGQSGNFIPNADKLNKDLMHLNYIIISHGHYDHSGGFVKLIEGLQIYPALVVGNEFFHRKYKRIERDEYKYNGNSFDNIIKL